MFLPSGNVSQWVAALRSIGPVAAPHIGADGKPGIAQIESGTPVDLGLDCRRGSIRELWMPQTEVLFRYTVTSEGVRLERAERDGRPAVVVGLRPCEAAAIRNVTKVMREGVTCDPTGAEAAGMTFVTLFCPDARPSCACSLFGPTVEMAEAASDVVLTPVAGGYVANALTERGEAAINAGEALFSDATAAQVAEAEEVHAALAEALPKGEVGALESSALDLWEHDAFMRHSERCLGCGICTYLCPACHCFDILDDKAGAEGVRYRCWDSCQFGHFTVHTSRHNPRPNQAARLRQRVLHKFLYMPSEFGVLGCTGCGRCTELCPVGISIMDVVAELRSDAEVSHA